jgi:16S rRNA (guanine527-N7)-methyltransferase
MSNFDDLINNDKYYDAIEIIRSFNEVSELQLDNLRNFVGLLLAENQNRNLIGKSTIDNIWQRHILDSAQLIKFIEKTAKKFVDLGSGAGFPGLILSIIGIKEMNLVEKSYRKCEFLRLARKYSSNKILVHNRKIEEIEGKQFDCVLSRALAPLEILINYANNLLVDKSKYSLFLKGRNYKQEIKNAQQKFNFDYDLQPSITANDSYIIIIKNIQQK